MFEEFSEAYYLGRLYVEPHGGDQPVLASRPHEQVNQELYTTGEGVERLDLPLVMKLDTAHFAVHAADDVPEGSLGLPEDLLAATDVTNPPALREVFLAKADRARQLLGFVSEAT